MKKIATIFDRDWNGDRSRVLDNPTPGCEWVFDGEGIPTRKYDGTCVMFDGTSWWARREVKAGKQAPANFRPVSHDHITLAAVGWEPIEQSPFAKFFSQAVASSDEWIPGTYELCGPKVQGNPEGYNEHVLIEHASADRIEFSPRTFAGIRDALTAFDIEGIVFHHEDGRRMAKIKSRDFGIRRGS